MSAKTFLFVLTPMMLIAACDDRVTGAATAEEAVKITNRDWAENLPQVNLKNLSVTTVDKGDRWRVTYAAPQGSAGGPFIYEVDKKTGKIVHSDGGQ